MVLHEKHPFLNASQEISPLCTLLEDFGLHHFTYIKVFKDGAKVSLSNKPQWIADYYNLKLYESSLFTQPAVVPEASSHEFQTWFGDYDLEVYRYGKARYNTMHSISITDKYPNSSENFLFSTTPDNPQAIQFLNNHREILYHFILYFKDKGRKLLSSVEKHRFALPAQSSSPRSNQKADQWLASMQAMKKTFFRKTPLHQCVLDQNKGLPLKLTQREMDCLYYLLQNKTASETGEMMNISSRTVESYLENIKNKLNCSTKAEILSKCKNNPYLKSIR